MRKQLVKTVEALLDDDPKLVLLLGDIGVFGFRESFKKHPQRVYNIGILEQATISTAAGLAMSGLTPVVHTIAPFLIERAAEQLKVDFGYQELGGNFISVGASYDYAVLGCTHHCPGDIGLLKHIPGMEIVVPGTGLEFDRLFRQAYANGNPTYFRLSEAENPNNYSVEFGNAHLVKEGSLATVLAVGPCLATALEAVEGLDAAVLYYTTLEPFDSASVRSYCSSGKILLCEPYYSGGITHDIVCALAPTPVRLEFAGVPHRFMRSYGSAADHDKAAGLTAVQVRRKLEALMAEEEPTGST